jgi:hypothetical protein
MASFESKGLEYNVAGCAKNFKSPDKYYAAGFGGGTTIPGTNFSEHDQYNAVSDYYSYMGSLRAHSKASLDGIASINRWLGKPALTGTGRLSNKQMPGLEDQASQITNSKPCTEAAPLEYEEVAITTLDTIRALNRLDQKSKSIPACKRTRNSVVSHSGCKRAREAIARERAEFLETSPWMKSKSFQDNLSQIKSSVASMEPILKRREAEFQEANLKVLEADEQMQIAADNQDREAYERAKAERQKQKANYEEALSRKSKSAKLYLGNTLDASLIEMRNTLQKGLEATIATSACIHGQEHDGKPYRPGCLSKHLSHLDSLPVIDPPLAIVENEGGERSYLRDQDNSVKLAAGQLGIASCRRSIRTINKDINDTVSTFAIHSGIAIGTLGLGSVLSASFTAAKAASAAGWAGKTATHVAKAPYGPRLYAAAERGVRATNQAISKVATPTVRMGAGAAILGADTFYAHETGKDVIANCFAEVEAEIKAQAPVPENTSCSGVQKVAGLSLELAARNCKLSAMFVPLDVIPFIRPTGKAIMGTYRGSKILKDKVVEFARTR